MEVLTFSLGLGLGLLLIALQQVRLNRNLRDLLSRMESRKQQRDLPNNNFSMTSRLMMAAGQQHQEQVQLKELLDSVQEIIAHAPLAYVQVDRDNYLVWCNVEASQLLDISPPSSNNLRLLLEQVRSYELDRLIEKTRRHQRPHQRRWVLHPLNPDPLNPDPRQSIHFMGHGIPLPEGQVGVFLENQQELFQLAQQRDRWVSDVAHELKTPLTSIRLVAEMLEERVEPAHQPWMQRLLGEVMHLSNLVHDLLDLNLLEQRATQTLNTAPLDLVHLLHSAWQSLEPIGKTKAIQMEYRGPQTAQVEADHSRLYRVILNLLDNGIKYSPSNSTITVQLSPTNLNPSAPLEDSESSTSSLTNLPSPDQAAISSESSQQGQNRSSTSGWDSTAQDPCYIIDIIDQGPGFPESSLAQVFERFYRADPARVRPNRTVPGSNSGEQPSPNSFVSSPASSLLSSNLPSALSSTSLSESSPVAQASTASEKTRTTGSCGLGLAIARQIVLAHGGTIKAQNHPETQGAWLQIRIPMEQGTSRQP